MPSSLNRLSSIFSFKNEELKVVSEMKVFVLKNFTKIILTLLIAYSLFVLRDTGFELTYWLLITICSGVMAEHSSS